MKFDTIVITAADESQAACFRLQAKAFAGVLARRILVVPDPGAKRVGTLGSTVGKTICKTVASGRPQIEFWTSLTTSEAFDISSSNTSGQGVYFHGGGEYVLNGDMNLNGGLNDWKIEANTSVTINGTVTGGAMWSTAADTTSAKLYWNGTFEKTGHWYFHKGNHYVNGHFTGSSTSFRPLGGYYRFLGEDVFTTRQNVRQESSDALTFSLEGFDQTCNSMGFSHTGDEAWNTFEITSASGNSWHVLADSAIAAKFTGNAGLVCEGGTSYLLKSSTSTGLLSVSGGATLVMLNPGSVYAQNTQTGAWAGDVAIGAGSKLALAKATSLASTAKLTLAGTPETPTGKLDIPGGCAVSIGEFWIGETRQPGGVYGGPSAASPVDHRVSTIFGEGTLVVPNWEKTNLTIDGDYEVPASGIFIDGTLAVIAAATITGGPITLDNGAVLDIDAETTIESDIVFGRTASGEAVTIDASKKATFNGVLSGVANIESIGANEVYFCGDNTFDGNLDLKAGTFYPMSDNAMGSANGWTRCDATVSGAPKIRFYGITTAEPLKLSDRSEQPNWIAFYGTNVFNGPVDICHAANQSWNFTSRSTTWFNGGFTNSASCAWMGLGMNNSNVEIHWNSRTRVGGSWYFAGGKQYFSSAVSFGGWRPRGINQTDETVLVFEEGASLASTFCRQENANWLAYDLKGADLSFTQFSNYSETDAKGRDCALNRGTAFRSSTGRTLTLTADNVTGQKFYGRFEGNVNLCLQGAGSGLTLGGENSTTGMLSVVNGGTVAFAPDAEHTDFTGTWAGDVVISGGSRVVVSATANLTGKKNTLTISGTDSVLEIPANVTVTCGRAFIDGQELAIGTYTAGSAAVGSHLAGSGTLRVHGLHPGLAIFIR